MRAIICDTYGGPEVLDLADDIPVPQPGPNGVLVRVHASSVNPVDCWLRKGSFSPMWKLRFPVIWGCDFSGVVEKVGGAVTLFQPGDQVYGFKHGKVAHTYRGTYAEYVVAPENTLAAKPARFTHEEAAAIPLVAVTAWQAMVDQGKLAAGHKVLVHAGAGGVGVMAIQIAKALGAYVAATAGPQNQSLLRELGADVAIDYRQEKPEDRLSAYHRVLDGVGRSVWAGSFKVLRRGGRLVTLTVPIPDPPVGKIVFYGSIISSVAASTVSGMLRGKRLLRTEVKPRGGDLEKISALIEAGKLRPVIEKVYALEQIADAHRASEKGHVRGKLVVKISR